MADDFLQRLEDARTIRWRRAYWINEVLRLAMPWRSRIDRRMSTRKRFEDDEELVRFDSILEQVVSDFASEIMQAFTPINSPWIRFKATQPLSTAMENRAGQLLQQYGADIFELISQTRFYAAAQECYHDLSAGVAAMLIYDAGPAIGYVCTHVPLPELLIDAGPYGDLEVRGREYKCRLSHFKAVYPQASLPPSLRTKSDKDEVTIMDGYWRDWSRREDEVWRRCVYLDKAKVYEQELVGPGSCPLIVGRWRCDGESPWGVGPGWTAVPPTRTLQEVQALIIANLQKVVDPPFFFDDDGVTNLDEGVEPGVGIPRMPGSTFEMMEGNGRFDVAWFEREELRQEVRRTHFQDMPHQAGKTPPTAAQWMDQRAEKDTRREGPANLFSHEWTVPVVQRFMHMQSNRGIAPEIRLGSAAVRVQPLTPTVKARDMESVRVTEMVLQMARQYLPDAAPAAINAFQTIRGIKETLQEKHVLVNDEQEIAAMAEQAAPALLNGAGGQ